MALCLPVRLSPKWLNVGTRKQRQQLAQVFLTTKILVEFEWKHLQHPNGGTQYRWGTLYLTICQDKDSYYIKLIFTRTHRMMTFSLIQSHP